MTDEERRRETAESEVDRRAASLSRSLQPERDLWPGIEARLDEAADHRRPRYWRLGALAAAVCAAALLPLLLREAPEPETTVPVTSVPETTAPAFDTAAQRLRLRNAATTSVEPGPEYQAARAELLARLEERLDELEPEEREIVVRNIETIRAALQEIDTALRENPDDPLLQELMLKTYRTELDVMARVNGLAGPARRRTDL